MQRMFFIYMERIYQLDDILSKIGDNNRDSYFLNFLSTKTIEAGIIRLHEDQVDTQSAHAVDKIYYVIEGEGFIQINGKNHIVKKGTSIFIPAEVEHNFYGNPKDLIVLYVLAGK